MPSLHRQRQLHRLHTILGANQMRDISDRLDQETETRCQNACDECEYCAFCWPASIEVHSDAPGELEDW